MQIKYAKIILPLPLQDTYTYKAPPEFLDQIEPGKRVIVPFGPRKYYAGIIKEITDHCNQPSGTIIKSIEAILDEKPIISRIQIKFWEWIAAYYMCTTGEVYKAALPAGLKPESETAVTINETLENPVRLTPAEESLISIVSRENSITVNSLSSKLKKNALPLVKKLLEKNVICISENFRGGYKPKMVSHVQVTKKYASGDKLNEAFDLLKNAPKQQQLLTSYLELSNHHEDNNLVPVSSAKLRELTGASTQTLKTLEEKGILETVRIREDRLDTGLQTDLLKPSELSVVQDAALKNIRSAFNDKNTVLLHGVTSSGKTEIYIHLINEYLQKGKQVLYLLPEIALTTQIITRLKKVFGHKVGVYHSKFSDSERVEIYNNLLKKDDSSYSVILGVRSSLFLPFSNLGLIIADEEHENSYKQYDPAPRYHARDASLVLAGFHEAKVLLGTATPSIESYFNTRTSKYGLVELTKRHKNIILPEIKVVDLTKAYKKREMHAHFSRQLVEGIGEALSSGQQVILFQNRRGFSPYLECLECGWVPNCKYCDVSLTWHKAFNKLVCHYCGFQYKIPTQCDSCKSTNLKTRGFGTEKVEDEIGILFPGVKTARLDLDSTRSKKSYEKIIAAFESGETKILIGTQMVTKGLDFGNVHLVGILNADNMLNFPDFRAFERSFQLMAQVSGRAGRTRAGKVIIQTSTPEHPVIKQVLDNNYLQLYQTELAERKKYRYPPFYRIVKLVVRHKDYNVLNKAAPALANMLRTVPGIIVLGPDAPIVGRVQQWYLKNIILKIDRKATLSDIKNTISVKIDVFKSQTSFKSIQVIPDVDPM